jgi:hypothetical protein
MKLEETALFENSCPNELCPPGSSDAVDACAGYGHPARCLCVPSVPESCNGATLGCQGNDTVKLCFAGTVVVGECNNCMMTPGGYYSCSR